MGAVSETIVREYFELHCFFVRQQRKYVTNARRDDEEIDFFVLNPGYKQGRAPLPFVLTSADLGGVSRALVVVKGWHTERFSAAVVSNSPEIFRFVEPEVTRHASRTFGEEGPLQKILVVPGLPQHKPARSETIALLRSKGIDAVLPFETILRDLIESVEINRNYAKSDLLQILRILKNYGFFKEPQLELFKPPRKRRATKNLAQDAAKGAGE